MKKRTYNTKYLIIVLILILGTIVIISMVKLNKKEEKVKEANWGEEVVLKRGASVLIGNKKLTFSDVILLKDYEGELAENLNKEAED